MGSVALPESGETVQSESLRFQRAMVIAALAAEVAWVAGLGFLLIRLLA